LGTRAKYLFQSLDDGEFDAAAHEVDELTECTIFTTKYKTRRKGWRNCGG